GGGGSAMLLVLSFFGEHTPVQVDPEMTFQDFRVLVEVQTGVPVAMQKLEGVPEGVQPMTKLGSAVADGDTIGIESNDEVARQQRDAERSRQEQLSLARAQEMVAEDQRMQEEHQAQMMSHETGGGFPDDMAGLFGRAASTVPNALRKLQDAAVSGANGGAPSAGGSTASSGAAAGNGAGAAFDVTNCSDERQEKRARVEKVDPNLSLSLSQVVSKQLDACVDFTTALGDVRRTRRPLLAIAYDLHSIESARLLSDLSGKLNDEDNRGIFSKFLTWMADAASPAYSLFVNVVENNRDLQQQMVDRWSPNVALPLILLIVPVAGGAVQLESVVHSTADANAVLAEVLQVIANHSERLEEERMIAASSSDTQQLKEELDRALEEAMLKDGEAQRQKEEEAAIARAIEQERADNEMREKLREEQAKQNEETERAAADRRRETRRKQLPAEAEDGSIRLVLRLPNGERVQRKFCPADKLELVFWVLDTTPVCLSFRFLRFIPKLPETQQAKLIAERVCHILG
ncbi:hypothetical protein DIPPA_00649, partial [Diplonema papillatum]